MPPLHILRVGSWLALRLLRLLCTGIFTPPTVNSPTPSRTVYHGITCGIVCADLSNVPSYFYE